MDITQFANAIKKISAQTTGQLKQNLLTNTPMADYTYMSQYAQTLPVAERYKYITTEIRTLSNYTHVMNSALITLYVGDTNPWRF